MSESAILQAVKFPEPFVGQHPLSKRKYEFAETGRLKEWAGEEVTFWRSLQFQDRSRFPLFDALSNEQVDQMLSFVADCDEIERAVANAGAPNDHKQQVLTQRTQSISAKFQLLNSGKLLSRDSPIASRMKFIKERSLVSAWAYRAIMHPAIDNYLEQARVKVSTLLRGAIDASLPEDMPERSQAEYPRVDELFNQAQRRLMELDKRFDDEKMVTDLFQRTAANAEIERGEQWTKRMRAVEDEWTAKLEVYNAKLAITAPTTYWSGKSVRHGKSAMWFGIFFVAVLAASLIAFCSYALPDMHALSGDPRKESVIATLAPVLIFGFSAIWILRILGRQLARHLLLRDESKERETMVMTFLAMMNDPAAKVSEKDRILILHALFRPSSGAAPDDAPPAHWFDLLTSRLEKSS
jgi:hypothetical protein